MDIEELIRGILECREKMDCVGRLVLYAPRRIDRERLPRPANDNKRVFFTGSLF